MTERLYQRDAYLREFAARVLEERRGEGGTWLRLDRSAFYPACGGQPCDTGTLRAGEERIRVLKVEADERGEVWHLADGALAPGTELHGEIDWARRFDHMQQHCGEHILAGCLFELHRALTIGLHIGSGECSIDARMPDGRTRLQEDEIRRAEERANERVQADAPVRCWFPGGGELEALPLRKKTAFREGLRVVAVGDFEMVACGGTHPASSGQVGLIHLLGTEPAKGNMRVRFVCGARAVRRCRACAAACGDAARLLSCGEEGLAAGVGRLLEENAALRREAGALRRQDLLHRLRGLLEEAPLLPGGARLVRAELPGADLPSLREAASDLVRRGGVVALLAAPGNEGCLFVFACSEGLPFDMPALLRGAGAKGGGRPGFAQGSAPTGAPAALAGERLLGGPGAG